MTKVTPEVSQQTTLFDVSEDTIDILPRLEIVQREEGFLATSRGELNEAFNLRSFAATPAGAATHLREVAQHQDRHGADPQLAQASIVREYASYAGKARADKTMLGFFAEEVRESAPANSLAVLNPNRLHSGRGQFVRFVDLGKLAATKDISQFPFSPLRGYTKGSRDAFDLYTAAQPRREVAEHISSVLSRTRAWEAMVQAPAAVRDQARRFDFWTTRIAEIEDHHMGATRRIAGQALKNLGVRK